MTTRAKTPQLHPLAALNLLCVAVAPLERHLAVGVGVDEHVEGAVAVELREEGDARGDLAEDCLDLGLDLGFGLFFRGGWRVEGIGCGAVYRQWCLTGHESRRAYDRGSAFSLSTGFFEEEGFDVLLKIWTYVIVSAWEEMKMGFHAHIKLPPLNVLASLLACDNHDELRYFAPSHPFAEL